MEKENDYYQALGVLPDAEQIVITAAYRALAGLYHPDRWKGDKDAATQKMMIINVAYGVLGDINKRKSYDEKREKEHGKFDETYDSSENAFDHAINDFEDRWNIALEIFPDLSNIRKNLAKTSHKLSFAFVVQIVEKKQYGIRHELASSMEKTFLKRYFGNNEIINKYAKDLIYYGCKEAIKKLNIYVDVLGSDVDPQVIIKKIESDGNLVERRNQIMKEETEKLNLAKKIENYRSRINYQSVSSETLDYAKLIGYDIKITSGGWFESDHYLIKKKNDDHILYEVSSLSLMCNWIKHNLT